jgi:hypothetical protein
MTIEQRLEHLEQQNQRTQRTNKRLTVALTMTVVAMCAVVTMAATGEKRGDFETVTARHVWVTNDAGLTVVGLGVNDSGDGMVMTHKANGQPLVRLTTGGMGGGGISTYQANGKDGVILSTTPNGGLVEVINKTGEDIAQMYADEYGNGVVWAGNRKGMGRELKPGP